ncbi:hypothetical protein [Roseovarius sp. BRH_c41]|jgi:hypothetical protein|uniref:hypothetical protein n=1 Tax=Roseovarius sp. BRH_c41 TaxID=1629709 RepID=UPI0005F0DB33|nr:hypothetical protein [Roseovarius sp. BRH_c41]KJS44626.1 MAG: hypothetical protein VR71_05290 [Roseovarius sp. BRH_c41]
MQSPEWTKPAIWSAIGGALAITIIGLNFNWVMLTGSAHKLADEQSEAAVLSALTPICVAQFQAEPAEMRSTQIAAMEKLSSWEQGDIVAKQGWATLPGSEAPNVDLAEKCSERLLSLAETA